MPVLDGSFEAFVTNLGKYNEGELVGEWVHFPTTEEEMKKVFERIGIGSKDEFGQVYEEWFIKDYDCSIHGVSNLLGEYENLDKINYLAARLDEMSHSELERFVAIMDSGCDEVNDLDDLINLTYNADICLLAPHVFNNQQLGALLYESGMLTQEAMTLLDTTEDGSAYRKDLLEVFGKQYQEDHGGVYTRRGYVEPGGDFKEVYNRKEIMPYFNRTGAPVVLEVRKGFFNDPAYDNDLTATLDLPAVDDAIWNAVETVDAASMKECAFHCVDCRIPSLRGSINDAIEDEGGIEQVNVFAQMLSQRQRVWDTASFTKYKALLDASGNPNLEQAIELAKELDQYELRPEIAEPWDYTEVILREKYPDLPEDLFQTPQAAWIGQKWLEQGDAAITDYGLIRRKDGGPLPCFRQEQAQQTQFQRGGMEMR